MALSGPNPAGRELAETKATTRDLLDVSVYAVAGGRGADAA